MAIESEARPVKQAYVEGSNEGTVKDWIKRGLEQSGTFPSTNANIETMYGRAMRESG